MHARMIEVAAKPGRVKDCIKALVERAFPFSSNSWDLWRLWL
jgi:hypothetical protein